MILRIAMVVELSLWPQVSKDQWDLIKTVAAMTGALLALATAVVKISGWLKPRWRAWRDRRTLRERVGAELYDLGVIQRATTYYIHPDCQSVDPAGAEEPRHVIAAREPLFDAVDRLLENPGQYKFVIVLADSGMGKTSFLLNYYAHHWWSRRHDRFRLSLVPLNLPNSDELIRKIPPEQQSDTVLCLDALDEDLQAVRDHRGRLGDLVSAARGFRTVIVTCRTQFFPKDEEIPTETGILKVGPVGPNEPRIFYLHKLYLAPFTDAQVDRYLRQRFPFWKHRRRRAARAIVAKAPDLVARPMLLAHVPDLVDTDRKIEYSFQIYQAMVIAWLEREKGLVQDSAALEEFSERLAADLFINRSKRQMERIPEAELKPLAEEFGIHLEAWQLRGRSLLNRDASGNYKFAHRSIMEYLFIRRFLSGDVYHCSEPWTDLMKTFVRELLRSRSIRPDRLRGVDLSNLDLRGIFHLDAFLPSILREDRYLNILASIKEPQMTQYAKAKRRSFAADAALLRVDANGANLSGTNLAEATLVGANLRGANLSRADLRGALLVDADLTEANLTEANLAGAILWVAARAWLGVGATPPHANLDRADLTGADLRGAQLWHGSLRLARGMTPEQIASALVQGPELWTD
ncbi:MAG TPA: pentapeptide repeat-containing protein [Candidatus Acidoferrum sp.]|jgi:uncharacterized protein YjbI with pentapeptide repeats|nr:pentapeptide repeat-containing protein [Candidatus Acidoferrum sp.]